MAGVALISAAGVTGTLAGGDRAIVTGRAISQYVAVIHHRRSPAIRVMTVLAQIGRTDVIRRFSGRTASVMTLDAPGNHAHM